MVTNLARRAMTTNGQKACLIIDHLVEALGGDASSSLRRAMILADIDQHPGTTQVGILERLQIHKSAVNREVDWLFNYGCIMMKPCEKDSRTKKIEICGYSKAAFDEALNYFEGDHSNLLRFLEGTAHILEQEKPTLRDAKIFNLVCEKNTMEKQEVIQNLYEGSSSTKNRAVNNLVESGILEDVSS